MKTIQKKMTKKAAFVVGAQLPDTLTKKTLDFLSNNITPQRAFEIAAQVTRIALQNKAGTKTKNAC